MESEHLLLCSGEPANMPYAKSTLSEPISLKRVLILRFKTAGYSKSFLSLRSAHQFLHLFPFFLVHASCLAHNQYDGSSNLLDSMV